MIEVMHLTGEVLKMIFLSLLYNPFLSISLPFSCFLREYYCLLQTSPPQFVSTGNAELFKLGGEKQKGLNNLR